MKADYDKAKKQFDDEQAEFNKDKDEFTKRFLAKIDITKDIIELYDKEAASGAPTTAKPPINTATPPATRPTATPGTPRPTTTWGRRLIKPASTKMRLMPLRSRCALGLTMPRP